LELFLKGGDVHKPVAFERNTLFMKNIVGKSIGHRRCNLLPWDKRRGDSPRLHFELVHRTLGTLTMPRQPFAALRQKHPGGNIEIGTNIIGERPELESLVGNCLMVWPAVEAEMALLLGHLLGASNPAALAVFQSLRRSSAQRDTIAEAARVTLNDTDQELLSAALNVHKSIEADRNALCHGHFGTYSNLPDCLLWMTTNDYVELRSKLHLANERFTEDLQRKLYSNMRVYRKGDLEAIYNDITYCGPMWTEVRHYLRSDARQRQKLYDQLCCQSRIAQALVTLRKKSNPSAVPQSPPPEPNGST
jgi:hypothetical protein